MNIHIKNLIIDKYFLNIASNIKIVFLLGYSYKDNILILGKKTKHEWIIKKICRSQETNKKIIIKYNRHFIYDKIRNIKLKYNYMIYFYGKYIQDHQKYPICYDKDIFANIYFNYENEIHSYIEKMLHNFVDTKKPNIFSIFLQMSEFGNIDNFYDRSFTDKTVEYIKSNQNEDWYIYYTSFVSQDQETSKDISCRGLYHKIIDLNKINVYN
jgi:hypothetical protein